MSIGEEIRNTAFREARRVLGEAVTYRREHPYVFYRFHAHMATLRRKQRRPFAAWWHRQWRERYYAKAIATSEGPRCARVMEGEEA